MSTNEKIVLTTFEFHSAQLSGPTEKAGFDDETSTNQFDQFKVTLNSVSAIKE